MKIWNIPVSWEVVGVVEIQAPTLDQAIERQVWVKSYPEKKGPKKK